MDDLLSQITGDDQLEQFDEYFEALHLESGSSNHVHLWEEAPWRHCKDVRGKIIKSVELRDALRGESGNAYVIGTIADL